MPKEGSLPSFEFFGTAATSPHDHSTTKKFSFIFLPIHFSASISTGIPLAACDFAPSLHDHVKHVRKSSLSFAHFHFSIIVNDELTD